MKAYLPASTGYRLLLILLLLTAWRLISASHRSMELYADEAQYFSWSLALDWGYYSKPPMVAWLIHLGTQLFGDGELGVRAMTFVLWPATAWMLYLTVRRLYGPTVEGEQAGFWAAVAFATLPMTSLGSWVITTDGPLLFFWTTTLYFLVRALQHDAWKDWALSGCFAGLGLLSKYSMVFFLPSLAVYFLISREHWHILRTAKPYAAIAVAALILAPNLIWNAQHQFVSIEHTAEISQLDKAWLHPEALLEFVVAQFGVFGPILAAGLLLVALRPYRLFADPKLRLLACFSLVPLAAFITLSLLSRAFANWAAFAYAAGAGLVAALWLSQGRRRVLLAGILLNLAIGAAIYHYHDLARLLNIELTRKTDPFTRVTGYRELGQQVAAILAAHPQARLLGDDRKTIASLIYYARPRSLSPAYLNIDRVIDDHYALTADISRTPQGEFILVTRETDRSKLLRWFQLVDPLGRLYVPVHRDHALLYRVWLVRNFKGYGAP